MLRLSSLIAKLFCKMGWHDIDSYVEPDSYDGGAFKVFFCRECGVETSFYRI